MDLSKSGFQQKDSAIGTFAAFAKARAEKDDANTADPLPPDQLDPGLQALVAQRAKELPKLTTPDQVAEKLEHDLVCTLNQPFLYKEGMTVGDLIKAKDDSTRRNID